MKMKKNLIKIFIEKLRIYFITQVYKQIVRKYLINTFQSCNHRHSFLILKETATKKEKGKYFISMSKIFENCIFEIVYTKLFIY